MDPSPTSSPVARLDHAVLGNGRVLALVSPTAAIEWLCLPRFDSPSVFARLLDREHGGAFRILHASGEQAGQMGYLRNTNVVRTVFHADDGSWEVLDFAPRIPSGLGVRAPYELMRLVRPLSGEPRLIVDFDPRPDYARLRPILRETTLGLEVSGPPVPFHLATSLPVPYVTHRRSFVLNRPHYFVLSHGPRDRTATLAEVEHDLDRTIAGWRAWSRSCYLPSFAPDLVLRSALVLKLHAFHDTGAIIAATTTSIPEAMGTERTWDYRYCWLRDAAFTVEALRRLGQVWEGEQFARYLRDVTEAGPLQPVYGIDGERTLDEIMLPHLAGFGGNGHVRIGNAAYTQRQHDVWGEIILCLETLLADPRIVYEGSDGFYPLVRRLVEDAITAAPRPDTSIWEFRSILRNYTFSRAMCWVAIHRGASLARRFGDNQTAERWEAIAAAEQRLILDQGFRTDGGYFTQSLGGTHPDASNLLLSTIGLVDARDPRFSSTVRAYEQTLVEHGLMLRYKNADDFGQTTSAFTICSFWWAEALALMGELEEAATVFERVAAYANPVGLFSEDIDPATGALLGNFPQAYTHVGLIHAAMTIGEMLEALDGRVRAWT